MKEQRPNWSADQGPELQELQSQENYSLHNTFEVPQQIAIYAILMIGDRLACFIRGLSRSDMDVSLLMHLNFCRISCPDSSITLRSSRTKVHPCQNLCSILRSFSLVECKACATFIALIHLILEKLYLFFKSGALVSDIKSSPTLKI